MKLIAIGSVIIMTMFTAPAFAQTSTNATHMRIIRTSDLNLLRREDIRIFKHRASIAVVDVCGVASGIDLQGAMDVIKCRHDLTGQTNSALLQAIALAQSNGRPVIQTAVVNRFPSVFALSEGRGNEHKD